MELNQLRIFVAVANASGFSTAAEALDMAPSSVTRAVANLERSLGVRLFSRTTRSVALTEAGESFLRQVTSTLDGLDAAAESVRRGSAELTGTLRLSASVSFGHQVIAPVLSSFCAAHPDLSIDLILSDTVVDLVGERIDVAIRHGDLKDSSLVARRLTDVRYRLVASPEYISRTKPIAAPKDVEGHACLTYPYEAFRSSWAFQKGRTKQVVGLSPKLTVSNPSALQACAKSGMGLALLADWIVDRDIESGALVEVLCDWRVRGGGTSEDPSLWIVTPSRAYMPEKTRVFVEFMRGLFPGHSPSSTSRG